MNFSAPENDEAALNIRLSVQDGQIPDRAFATAGAEWRFPDCVHIFPIRLAFCFMRNILTVGLGFIGICVARAEWESGYEALCSDSCNCGPFARASRGRSIRLFV